MRNKRTGWCSARHERDSSDISPTGPQSLRSRPSGALHHEAKSSLLSARIMAKEPEVSAKYVYSRVKWPSTTQKCRFCARQNVAWSLFSYTSPEVPSFLTSLGAGAFPACLFPSAERGCSDPFRCKAGLRPPSLQPTVEAVEATKPSQSPAQARSLSRSAILAKPICFHRYNGKNEISRLFS